MEQRVEIMKKEYTAVLQRHKGLFLLFSIFLSAAVILGLFLAGNAFVPARTKETPASAADMELDPNATDEKQLLLQHADPENLQTTFAGFEKARVDGETGRFLGSLENPKGNSCYFAISIFAEEELVYQSKWIAPGQYINMPELSKKLKEGTYAGTIRYDCYHVVTEQQINGAEFHIQLIVSK